MNLRWSGVVVLSVALSGCYNGQMVVDRAWLEADVPVPPPAFVPDTSRPGDRFVQLGIRVAEGQNLEVGNEQRWDLALLSAQLQLQMVVTPHLRWVLGGGYSNSASLWTGPVMSVRNSILRWDIGLLMGGTWVEGGIVGHETWRDAEGGSHIGPSDSIRFDGMRFWGQFALRTRLHRTGPWLEGGVMPSFRWGTLEGDVNRNSQEAMVETAIGVLGAGWIQEFRSGSSAILGVRAVLLGSDALSPQLSISWQKRMSR